MLTTYVYVPQEPINLKINTRIDCLGELRFEHTIVFTGYQQIAYNYSLLWLLKTKLSVFYSTSVFYTRKCSPTRYCSIVYRCTKLNIVVSKFGMAHNDLSLLQPGRFQLGSYPTLLHSLHIVFLHATFKSFQTMVVLVNYIVNLILYM